LAEFTLTRKRIRSGQYEGILTTKARRKTAPKIDVVLLGTILAEAQVTADTKTPKTWAVQAKVPSVAISDGVQTFTLVDKSNGMVLDSFAIVAGETLQDDFRAEIALLRAELDLLKQAFRQHCNETKG
jgi:hypothetical protein